MEYDFKPGDIVLSLAGRDSGRYFIVLKSEGIFAYICDGDLRKADKPKKKKFKHLKFAKECSYSKEKLSDGEKLTNAEIRRALQEFSEENNI